MARRIPMESIWCPVRRRIGSRYRLLFCPFFLLVVMPIFADATRMSTARRNPDIKRLLTHLNKPFVKSIKSLDGDIIDCVDINRQPGLNHRGLTNHTIQMRPSFHPKMLLLQTLGENKTTSKTNIQMWRKNGSCAKGTIPIRRTREEDVFKAYSTQAYGRKRYMSMWRPPYAQYDSFLSQNGHQHAIAYTQGDKYYGAKASLSVWNPTVQQSNEFSLSQIWILAGSDGDLNSIEAGWMVHPQLYGDYLPRLFTYWTTDNYQSTGCYNLICPGFVQVNNKIALGASINPSSSYGGNQYDITISIWKDPKDGNWWLSLDDQIIGYWQSSYFSRLSDSANIVEWGGEVVDMESNGHTTTTMGSGHFAQEGYGKAGFIRNMMVADASNYFVNPKELKVFTDAWSCYNVQVGYDSSWQKYIYYGGPGKNSQCP